MNATLTKFGYPGSLVREYHHWCVLLRPQQVTLGALVLATRGNERAFSALPASAFVEFGAIVHHIEVGLKAFRPFDRINYLMLMMVDPHVHFHVLPRYAAPQSFDGVSFPDAGWPSVPDLKQAPKLKDETLAHLRDALQTLWPRI